MYIKKIQKSYVILFRKNKQMCTYFVSKKEGKSHKNCKHWVYFLKAVIGPNFRSACRNWTDEKICYLGPPKAKYFRVVIRVEEGKVVHSWILLLRSYQILDTFLNVSFQDWAGGQKQVHFIKDNPNYESIYLWL